MADASLRLVRNTGFLWFPEHVNYNNGVNNSDSVGTIDTAGLRYLQMTVNWGAQYPGAAPDVYVKLLGAAETPLTYKALIPSAIDGDGTLQDVGDGVANAVCLDPSVYHGQVVVRWDYPTRFVIPSFHTGSFSSSSGRVICSIFGQV